MCQSIGEKKDIEKKHLKYLTMANTWKGTRLKLQIVCLRKDLGRMLNQELTKYKK